MSSLTLYYTPRSGHCHRVQLMLSLLGAPVNLVAVNLAEGEHKSSKFLRMNPFGQVPVLEDNGVVVADSNAILVYLIEKFEAYQWMPRDPAAAATVQRWLSVAAGELFSGPCSARLITVFGAKLDAEAAVATSHALLKVMDAELAQRDFLAGAHPTIADIAHYSYIAHAPEGNVSLDKYRSVLNWLSRIEALPGFLPMPKSNAGLVQDA